MSHSSVMCTVQFVCASAAFSCQSGTRLRGRRGARVRKALRGSPVRSVVSSALNSLNGPESAGDSGGSIALPLPGSIALPLSCGTTNKISRNLSATQWAQALFAPSLAAGLVPGRPGSRKARICRSLAIKWSRGGGHRPLCWRSKSKAFNRLSAENNLSASGRVIVLVSQPKGERGDALHPAELQPQRGSGWLRLPQGSSHSISPTTRKRLLRQALVCRSLPSNRPGEPPGPFPAPAS